MVVIVRISEEITPIRKNIGRAHIWRWQAIHLRTAYFVHLFLVIIQVLANLIPQVCVGVLVAHNFNRVIHANGAMVSCKHYLVALFGYFPEQIQRR